MDKGHDMGVEPGRGAGAAELFAGPGEVRALARTLDWGATPLGWPDTWSPALRIATRAMLDSPFPICLWSGPHFALVYDDGYRRILAAKHPAALGQPGSVVWAEIREGLEAQFSQVRAGGPPLSFENARSVMARLKGGGTEDAWFSYSLSALRDEDGGVAAVLNISPETTGQVLAERALEVERTRLEAVFQQSPSFVAVLRGAENVFEIVNEAYEQIVGQGRALLGKPLFEALPKPYGPNNLRDLIVQLGEAGWGENPETAYSRLVRTAAAHGEHRMRFGYAESLLFTEYHLLREAVWRYMEQHREYGAGSQAVRLLDGAITDATSVSLFGCHRAALEVKGRWPGAIEGLVARGRGKGG